MLPGLISSCSRLTGIEAVTTDNSDVLEIISEPVAVDEDESYGTHDVLFSTVTLSGSWSTDAAGIICEEMSLVKATGKLTLLIL